MKKLGIYIHIPFCVRKCKYCDFLSFDSLKEDVKGRYVNALFSEIKMQGKRFQGYEADTIFIGGGTPTVVQAEYIAEIVECVKENFHLAEAAEITIEANPGTLTPEMLEIYRKSGVNRLSIGVQSLDDKVLSALGRIHTAEEFRNTYFAARHAGFNNINIDLMFAVPLQTEEIWEKTLKEAIRLKPEHISFYSLQLEEGTEFYRMYKEGRLTLADDDTDRRMYHTAVKMLKEAGYHHYEISNAAKPGFESRHNMKYWQFDEYIGLGLGASSFTGGKRFANTSIMDEYLAFYEGMGTGGCPNFDVLCKNADPVSGQIILPQDTVEKNTEADSIFEYIFTGLRLTSGIDLARFKSIFGKNLQDYYPDKAAYIKQMIASGFMFCESGFLGLTLSGIDISNGIMSEFSEPYITD